MGCRATPPSSSVSPNPNRLRSGGTSRDLNPIAGRRSECTRRHTCNLTVLIVTGTFVISLHNNFKASENIHYFNLICYEAWALNPSATARGTNHFAACPAYLGEDKVVLGPRGGLQSWIPRSHILCGIIGNKGVINQGLTSSLNTVIIDVYECAGLFDIFCSAFLCEVKSDWNQTHLSGWDIIYPSEKWGKR